MQKWSSKKQFFGGFLISVVLVLLLSISHSAFARGAKAASQPVTAYPFFKNEISIGYFNRNIWNPNLPRPPSPLFWGASTKVDNGFILMYQRMVYHTLKYFSISLGLSGSGWKRQNQDIFTVSGLVMFKFYFLRFFGFVPPTFSPYLLYSVAGPTLISRRTLGTAQLGENFLFQDILELGLQLGMHHAVNMALEYVHYSNGDIFEHNNGFGVPIVFVLGLSFP